MTIDTALNLLLVDSDNQQGAQSRKIMEDEGHFVTWRQNSLDAQHAIEKEPFDAVFIEIDTEAQPLFTLVRQFKSNPLFTHLPFIALTRTDNPALVRCCFEAGIEHFILKPLTHDKLTAALYLYKHLKHKQSLYSG